MTGLGEQRCGCRRPVRVVPSVDGGLLVLELDPSPRGRVIAVQVHGRLLGRVLAADADTPAASPRWAVHRCPTGSWARHTPTRLPSPLPMSSLRCLRCDTALPVLLVDLGAMTHPCCAEDDLAVRALAASVISRHAAPAAHDGHAPAPQADPDLVLDLELSLAPSPHPEVQPVPGPTPATVDPSRPPLPTQSRSALLGGVA